MPLDATWGHLLPASGATGVDVLGVPITVKSKGRMEENNATCATDITAGPGCAPSAPYLALNPGPNSKWRFEPAGNGAMRYYISQDVSVFANGMLLLAPTSACTNGRSRQPVLQARATSSCTRKYLGIGRSCNEIRTELVTLGNASASLVWVVEPVLPMPPTIASASLIASALTALVSPPGFPGFSRK